MTKYPSEKEIVTIKRCVIENYSPTELCGLKDPEALDMCVNLPKQEFFGKVTYPTIYDKTAILFEKLINKHCFHNGNKRTTIMAIYVFLNRNGVQLTATNKELADIAVNITSLRGINKLSTSDISHWLENNSK